MYGTTLVAELPKASEVFFELGLAGSLVDPGCQVVNLEQVLGRFSPLRLDLYPIYHGA